MAPTTHESAYTMTLDPDSGPLWFKPEKFTENDFNSEQYVNDLKRYVPLETLNAQLSAHADALRARLVEVVNEDYDEFVSLSTKLVDVDGAVARLQAPLKDVKSRVDAARASVHSQGVALQDGLARRQAAAAARALLELAQDAVHVMAKVEKLLAELPHEGGSGSSAATPAAVAEAEQEELEGRSRLLDRLCSEVSRLNFFVARGSELAVVRQMSGRIQRATESLQAELDAALTSVLAAQNPTALSVLLHAYGSLGHAHAAEEVVRRQLVAPVVAAAIETAAQTPLQRAADGEGGDPYLSTAAARISMVQALQAVHAALRREVAPFLELAMSPAGGAAPFDFLGGAVLPEVAAAVDRVCPGAYSPGIPDAFHANYTAADSFVESLEQLCVNAAQVERFRGSPSYAAFRKKWNLAAYFSLRFQDVAGALEEALSTAGLKPAAAAAVVPAAGAAAAAPPPPFKFAATAAAWQAMQSAAAPSVFLRHLADRFLRLELQVAARFCNWATAELQQAQQGQQQGQQPSGDIIGGGSDGGDSASEGVPTPKPSWAVEVSVEQLAALSQDYAALREAVRAELAPQFAASVDAEAAGPVAAAFTEADAQLGEAGGAVLGAAANGLVDRCCEALKQLRGIVATFRMTNRGAPTRPAQYASAILAPLDAFFSGASGLDDDGRAALVRAVLDGVAVRYRQLAHETLSTVRKTESSLRRLKSRKTLGAEGEGADGPAALGTDDLIALQLKLDIQEFGKRVRDMGVDPETLASFQELAEVVVAPHAEAA